MTDVDMEALVGDRITSADIDAAVGEVQRVARLQAQGLGAKVPRPDVQLTLAVYRAILTMALDGAMREEWA